MCRRMKTHNARSGFTLIEMVVVVLILSLAAALVLPRLPATDTANLRGSARSLAAAIRYLGDLSITTKTPHRLHLNLSEERVSVTRKNSAGEQVSPNDSFLGRRFLADGIVIEDVMIPRLGKVAIGEVMVDFGAAGLEEFVIIHLRTGQGSQFTIAAFPHSGKVKVVEGYLEEWT